MPLLPSTPFPAGKSVCSDPIPYLLTLTPAWIILLCAALHSPCHPHHSINFRWQHASPLACLRHIIQSEGLPGLTLIVVLIHHVLCCTSLLVLFVLHNLRWRSTPARWPACATSSSQKACLACGGATCHIILDTCHQCLSHLAATLMLAGQPLTLH